MAPTVEYLRNSDLKDFVGKHSDEIRDNVGLHSNTFLQALRTPGIISDEDYSAMQPKDAVQRNLRFVDLLLNPPFVLMDPAKVTTFIELCESNSRPELQELLKKWRDILKGKIESYKTYESFVQQLEKKYSESFELDEKLLNGLKAADEDGKRCLPKEIVKQIREETRRKDKNELFFKFLWDGYYGAKLPFLQFVKTLKYCTNNDKHPIALAFETYYELRRDRKELKSQDLIDEVFKVTGEKAGTGIESKLAGSTTPAVDSKFAAETLPAGFVDIGYWHTPATEPAAVSAAQVPLRSLNPFVVSSSQPTRASAWQKMPGQQSCQAPAIPHQGQALWAGQPDLQNQQAPPRFGGSRNRASTLPNGEGDSVLFIAILRNYRDDLLKKTEIRSNRQLKKLSELNCISTKEYTEINMYPEIVMEQRVLAFLEILANKKPPYLDLLNNLIEAFHDLLNQGTANIFRRIREEMFPQIPVVNVIEPTAAPQLQNDSTLGVPKATVPNPVKPTLKVNDAKMVEMLCYAAGFWWYLDDAGRLWLSTQKKAPNKPEDDMRPKYSPDLVDLIKTSPDSAPVFGTIHTIAFAGPDIPVDTVQKILSSPKFENFRINTMIFFNVSFSSQQWAQKRSDWDKKLGRLGFTSGPSTPNSIRHIRILFDDTSLIGSTKISKLIKPIMRLLSQKRTTSALEAWSNRNSIDFQVLVDNFKVLRFHSQKTVKSPKHLVVGRCPQVSSDACKVNKTLQRLTDTLSGFSGLDIDESIKRTSLQSASLTYLNLNFCDVDDGKIAEESERTIWYSQLFFQNMPVLETLIVVGCKLRLELKVLAGNERLKELVIANDQVHLPAIRSDFEALGTIKLGVNRKIVICGCHVNTEEARQYLGIEDASDPYWLILNSLATLGGFESFRFARPLQWRFGGCKPESFDDVQASKDRNLVLSMLNVDDFMDRDDFDKYCKF